MCSYWGMTTSTSGTIAAQLRQAWQGSEMMLEDLRQRAGLECTADSLSRKLAGKQILTTTEAELIAQALEHTIVWAPRTRGTRRRAA
jgi:hypothetical protein